MNKEDIFKIGIGSWKIDYENFDNDMQALIHSHEKGQNYLPLYMLYNDGQVVKQMAKFVEKVGRDKLFITVNLEPTIEKVEDIEKQLNEYLSILKTDYVDSIQIHGFFVTKIPLISVYLEIARLKRIGKVKHIGICNVSLEQLKEVNETVKLDFFEGVYNLECKKYEDIGVLDYCKKNNIQFICYQPLRRNRTAQNNYPVLVELAEKYKKTQNQIIINWIVNEKNIIPLIKSTEINRIDENIDAINFKMDKEDYERLNQFRNADFDSIKIDWELKGGVTIDQLANQF